MERKADRVSRSRPTMECAQCGEPLYMPEWSECLEGGRVRHLWRCDACDYAFETIARFAVEEAA